MLDLVQNALEADASRVAVQVTACGPVLSVVVSDDGCGMDPATLNQALDPFYTNGRKHRHRRFGLGLPFLKQQVDAVGGTLDIHSEPGRGTTVRFTLNTAHVDAPPMADWPDTLTTMMNFPGNHELIFERADETRSYAVKRSELLDALENLETAESLALARRYLVALEEDFAQPHHGEETHND